VKDSRRRRARNYTAAVPKTGIRSREFRSRESP
jgi:hypothetical protein